RTTDFVARFGGEEFVVLFPETEPSDARAVVDKLREHVGKLPFHFRGEPVTVTFSAGLAGFIAGDTEESVFDRADRALYQAKDAGRDQVMISDSAEIQ
ncbi:MAG: GGDEF domain-containing protein, partial [Pseudoalteromonas sp.]|nr:GGDEF domain-containing protein [Pseudoalteromonas sp.]